MVQDTLLKKRKIMAYLNYNIDNNYYNLYFLSDFKYTSRNNLVKYFINI